MPDQGVFEFRFAVLIPEVEELQQIRIANFVLSGNGIFRLGHLSLRQQGALPLGV